MKQAIFFLLGAIVLAGCGKAGGGKGDNPVPQQGKIALLSPAQNELCTQGSVISAAESTVTLKWSGFSGSNSYELTIKNLADGSAETRTTGETQAAVTLERNMPYSWSVISRSAANAVLAKSEVWKFYNSGPAGIDYAPFPAEIVSPAVNEAVTVSDGRVNLVWHATDVDNDIVSYDVYLGETSQPALVASAVTASATSADVSAGKTYYWKVVTRDAKGNTSDSGVFEFMTK
ncbi:hypothetical protein [Mucilaginibacter ginsenosidivorans]|uniref:Fibronectin type-III domain-containing protein n=1 Tax=Mucilaginibacter ginsenosidivorans TaxID=398053 RepID=A0A5B8UTQ0_9SPHI|nr:hypothetical protein [Mucilaginibacter ginsenosidivorans]QEC62490.1 hypothetical protein FRZ54_07780 [Mucilaginibacter ginsenosidivorans]